MGRHLPHRRVLERLQQAGAEVDHAAARGILPTPLLEKTTGAMNGGRHIAVRAEYRDGVPANGRQHVSIGPGNQGNIVDYGTRGRHQATTKDVIRGLVPCNELPRVPSAMPLVTPADMPQVKGDLYG